MFVNRKNEKLSEKQSLLHIKTFIPFGRIFRMQDVIHISFSFFMDFLLHFYLFLYSIAALCIRFITARSGGEERRGKKF
jgi:hypothetical protein